MEDIGNIIQPVEDIFVLNFSTVLKRTPGQSVPKLSEYSQRIITGAFSHTSLQYRCKKHVLIQSGHENV